MLEIVLRKIPMFPRDVGCGSRIELESVMTAKIADVNDSYFCSENRRGAFPLSTEVSNQSHVPNKDLIQLVFRSS